MANGNSLENTFEVYPENDIFIEDKLYQYKDIQAQIDAKAPGFENIKTVTDYVKAWGNKARVEQGRDAFGQLITKEKATMVDEPRVEKPGLSEWSKEYGKNFTIDQMEVEFQTYTNAVNLNESQQSDINSFINEDDPNYDPNLLKPRAPERFTMEMATAVTPVIQPYQNEFNQAKKYLESGPKKKGDKPATRDEIEKLTRIIIANNKEANYRDSNAKKYLDDKSDNYREALFDYKNPDFVKGSYVDRKFLDDQQKEILDFDKNIINSSDYKNYNNLSDAYKNLNTELLDLKNEIEELQKRPEILENNIDKYNNLVNNFNNKLKNYQQVYKGLQDSSEALNIKGFQINEKIKKYEKNVKIFESQDDLGVLLDYLKRDYSQINKVLGARGSGEPGTFAVGMIKAGVDIGSFIEFQLFGEDVDLIPGEKKGGFQDASQIVRAYEDKQRGKFYKPITFDKAFSSLSNFGEFMVDQAVQQSSFLAAMSINPYLTIGISGGSYIADRQKEAATFGGRSYTEGELLLKSIGFGATEYIFGTAPTMGILRRARRRLNDAGKRELVEGYKNRFDYLLKNSPVLAWDFGIESSTESITTFFQNAVDGKPLLNGMGESAFVGGMFGFTFSGVPMMYGAALNNFSDYNTYQGYRNNLDMIARLKRNNSSPFVNEKDKQQNLKTIKDLEAENSETLNQIENNVNEELTSEGFNLYQAATNRQEQLRIEAEQILNNKSLPKDIRDKKLKPLKAEFDQLQAGRDAFRQAFTKTFTLLDKKERSRLNDLAVKSLQAKGTSIPSEQAILQEAENIYNSESIDKNAKNDLKIINNLGEAGINISYNLSDSNAQILKDYKEILDGHVANPNVDLTQAQADAKFNRFKEGIENGTINGINEAVLDNKSGKNIYNVLVSKQNSVANGKQHTGIHEIGHTIFTEAFTSNSAAFKDLSNVILDYLKKSNPEAYTRITTRTAGQNVDEVLTNFLEEVAAGNIDFKKAKNTGFLGPIGRILGLGVSSVANTDYSFNFKGETDVANFLTNLAKKLKAGDLSVKDIRTIKQEGIAGRKVDDDVSVETKESLTPSQQQLKQRFTNEQLLRKRKNAKGKELSDIDNILIEGGARVGLRAMGFDTRKGLGNISYNDALQTARTRIIERGLLDKFDAKINDNWSTYVGANLRFDIKDVIQQNQVSIDAASIDTEAAKQIADPTTVEVDQAVETKQARKINILQDFTGVDQSSVTNIVKVKDGDTYKQVSEYTGDVANAVFNIPGDKATVGKQNLTYAKKIVNGVPEASEAGNIQDWIRKGQNAENFIKILPRQSVTSDTADINELGENIDVDRDVLGLAIGLKGLVQNYFYNKTNKRSKGKKSQPFIWELKPEFINPTIDVINKLKVDAGITEAGQLNNYNRDIGQLLKGIAKVYSQQAAFSAAQRNLEATIDTAKDQAKVKKQIAGITAAQSKTAFSETVDAVINIKNLFELETKGKDDLLQNYINEKSFDLKTEQGILDFVEAVKTDLLPLLPKDMVFGPQGGSIFTPSYYVIGSSDNIVKKAEYKRLYNEVYKPAIEAIKNDPNQKYGDPIPGIKNYSIAKYNSIFKNASVIEKNIKNGKINEWNKNVSIIHKEMWKRFNNAINKDGKINKQAAKVIANYLGFVANDTSHFHKLGARFIGYSTVLEGKRFEYEHAMPATAAYLYLLDASLSNANFDTSYELVMKNYTLIALDKAMDNKLRQAKTKKGYSLQRRMPDDWSVIEGNWWERYFNNIVYSQKGGINPLSLKGLDGKTFAETLNIDAAGNATNVNIEKSKSKAFNKNPKSKFSKSNTNEGLLNDLNNYDKALSNARVLDAPVKGISIFDFDDTLATSKSKVIVTVDGKTNKITPAEFAKQHSKLEEQGAEFDFSEFNKVVDGKPGPLVAKIKKAINKFGNKDVFVLTARPQASATSIKAFLDGIGVNIPLENITGLEDGTPQAKANWVVSKAAEGYNDFYFTDDVYKNVKAVQDALEVLDVKSKTRLAYSDRVKKLDKDFNDILEAKTGIASEKEYSPAKAQVVGAGKGRYEFFVPPSAEDFVGLLYKFLAKGKLGDNQMAWFKKNLLDPYATAMGNISRERTALMNDYKALKKEIGIVPKNLRKKIAGENFTNEQALRVYIWNKQGMDVPGLSKTDLKELTDYIENNTELKVFGDQLISIHKADGYPKPAVSWLSGTISTDIIEGLNTISRPKHLQQWQQNADIIFSEKNLNKIEAAYGKPLREALENILKRMKTGKNRGFTGDSITGRFTDWLTGSIGAIMFFNTRSALLQTISTINFINYSDNNIFKAGKAYANQKQYWKDFMFLMNSDFLVDRRRGLRFNVNENDIANMANEGGPRGVVNKMLEFGFLPTQIADSFAIAAGGATFYRNRFNTYKKQGLSDQQAQEKAFKDFRETAEESQQSSRPDRISQQQAGPLGRIILAFQNVTMQFNRVGKKNFLDLKNGRRVIKADGTYHTLNKSRQIQLSKMGYYFVVQNLIFNALQQAIFAIAFGDTDDEEDTEKYFNIANGMIDSILRGTGIFGGVLSVIKNSAIRIQKESEKPNPKYEKVGYEITRLSPPISSKLSKITSAARSFQWEKDEMREKGFAIDNPALMAGAQVVTAATNVPLDRLVRKANNISKATNSDLETWQRIALLGGWQDWELGIDDEPKKSGSRKKFKRNIRKRRKIN